MGDLEPTRTCGACHKEVTEANFALHESHCKRFLSLCPDCDEAVPRDQLSQHKEEQHGQVKCSKCRKKMERCHLENHEAEECPERLQKCPFCELEVPWKQLQEHSVVCGSRTDLCKDCGRYVQLSEQLEHKSICPADEDDSPQAASGAPDPTENRVSCGSCRRSFLAEEIDQHELECFQASQSFYEEVNPKEESWEDEDDLCWERSQDQLSSAYKAISLSHTNRPHRWVSGADPDQISTCPHCHLALPLPTLKWHEAKCRIHVVLKDREL